MVDHGRGEQVDWGRESLVKEKSDLYAGVSRRVKEIKDLRNLNIVYKGGTVEVT